MGMKMNPLKPPPKIVEAAPLMTVNAEEPKLRENDGAETAEEAVVEVPQPNMEDVAAKLEDLGNLKSNEAAEVNETAAPNGEGEGDEDGLKEKEKVKAGGEEELGFVEEDGANEMLKSDEDKVEEDQVEDDANENEDEDDDGRFEKDKPENEDEDKDVDREKYREERRKCG